VRLIPKSLNESDRAVLPALEAVVRHAFGQRRKTLRNSLRPLLDETEIRAAGMDPGLRAERLSLEAFRRLAESVGRR
jgi:16S rRNA (adenine1518-N6/adenine1519-N6)-dimethyltransferase